MQTIREDALAKFTFSHMRKVNKFDVNHIFGLFFSKKLLQIKENIERMKIQKKNLLYLVKYFKIQMEFKFAMALYENDWVLNVCGD